ncbi:hypothetical protein B7463_g3782, partial [Scytalidium lignicola]
MVPLAPVFKKAYLALAFGVGSYVLSLIALTNPWLQRNVLYAHKAQQWWLDSNKPEQFGFVKNQVTPFNFTTPDQETIYAWHILPLGLYAEHESELLQQPSGCAEDITKTRAFELLKTDPESRLIIIFHGNAGTVAQGWRPDSYRALSDGSTSNIHILAIDYRGYGLSTGFPTEEGMIIDGVAAVDWAIQVAQIPPDRIVIFGQSMGTAVTAGVIEHFAQRGTDFAGVVLVAGFMNLPDLLTSYSIAGMIPVLTPLKVYPGLQNWFKSYIVDTWPSATRIANFVRLSKKVRLVIMHAIDDYEVPCWHADVLFAAAANATTEEGMNIELFEKTKARTTIDMGEGAFRSTWKAGGNKIIVEEMVAYGGSGRGPREEAPPSPTSYQLSPLTPSVLLLNPQDEASHYEKMAEESIAGSNPSKEKAVEKTSKENEPPAQVESDDEDGHDDAAEAGNAPTSSTAAKKKKSKKKRAKAGPTETPNDDNSNAAGNLTSSQAKQLLTWDPSIAQQFGLGQASSSTNSAVEALKRLKLDDIMATLAASGKNVKDMAAYKFWQTQPVPRLGEKTQDIEEGPFKIIDPDNVPKEPGPLVEGFEWVTVDITDKEQLKEVYELLAGHYVEDLEEMFRFNYSQSFLKWALMAPGWRKEWHVGVRASTSKKLVAFISGVPIDLRVRKKVLKSTEINFLCVHRKLRSKRLTPVLIKEITRRCYLVGVYQAIYTAGIVLPTPVSTCRYFHRSLNWMKLYEVGFSPLPKNSKPQYQVRKYQLPDHTTIKGLRPMEVKDIDTVLDSLRRYLARYDMAPEWTREEIEHWLIYKKDSPDAQVIWSYVVEDPSTNKITDFFSFYSLESSVIRNTKYDFIHAAYLYYYFTDVAFQPNFEKSALKSRLNALMNDALILAKQHKFDVFNCVSIMDNSLFVEEQKFGGGDGQLHYYLYNYKANPIAGGVDPNNQVDENCSGVGITML